MRQFLKVCGALTLCLLWASAAVAQTPTYVKTGQSVLLNWDAGGAVPPEEGYRVELLQQPTPSSVVIRTIDIGTPTTTRTVAYAEMPEPGIPFYFAVRAVRTVNEPGVSERSNVIGPFVKPALLPPTGLTGSVTGGGE